MHRKTEKKNAHARKITQILDFYIGDLETPATEVAAASIVDKKDA